MPLNQTSTLYDQAVPPRKVLCVCLGNICRSPTAEAVLQQQVARAGLSIQIDSAGTSNYHPNKAPDPRSQRHAALRGIDLSGLRARQVVLSDFVEFDLILAMDRANLADLQRMQQQAKQQARQQAGQHNPAQRVAQLALMSQHDALWPQHDVPDPYYGEQADFERVLDQCDSAAQGWLRYWQALDQSR